ncbi:MAG: hypothetical protein ACOYZ7_20460 [Chloroflexota bacterium]
MHEIEKSTVKLVAKLAPWLAPFPSAFFVARASMAHLELPLFVAVVVAAILETLGLATVHTALWLSDWNAHKRKTDPNAPTLLAVALGVIYLIATMGLTVVLEVTPGLATYAPALFPVLAVVGAVNLALISQQEQREGTVKLEKAERQAKRQGDRKETRRRDDTEPTSGASKSAVLTTSLDTARQARKTKRDARLDALLTFYLDNPDAGPTDAGRHIGVSRQTVYTYLDDLRAAGRIAKDNGRVEILEA